MFRLFPNNDRDPQRGVGVFGYADDPSLPLLLFDHAHSAAVPRDAPVVLLLREPLDALVSNYFQIRFRLRAFSGDVDDFVLSHPAGIAGLTSYLNGWASRFARNPGLVITYESMHQDMFVSCKHVLAYMNCRLDEQSLTDAIGDSRFARMQEIELSSGFSVSGSRKAVTDANALRAREGKVGGSLNHLSAEGIRAAGIFTHRNMSDQAKRLLIEHDLGGQLGLTE